VKCILISTLRYTLGLLACSWSDINAGAFLYPSDVVFTKRYYA